MKTEHSHRQESELAKLSHEISEKQTHVYNFLLGKTKNAELAKDLAQDTMERALKRARTYDAEKGKLENWLITIASRALIDHQRKQRIRRSDSLERINPETGEPMEMQIPSDEVSPEQIAMDRQELHQVREAMQSMSERNVGMLSDREVEGMSFDEIGKKHHTKPANAKLQIHRVREKLRNMFRPKK